MSISGKRRPVVLITGCDSGIGRALAMEFHRRGAAVIATGLDVEALANLGERGMRTVRLDITDDADIDALVTRLDETSEVIDILVNNAGFGAMGPTVEMPLGDVRAQYDVNVFGTLALTQAIANRMIEHRSGRIVTIGSTSGILTTPFAGIYCSTKTAIHAIMDALRMELAPFGVDVIRIEPNQIRTAFGDKAAAALRKRFEAGSRYEKVKEAAIGRAQASQHPGSMPAEEFARIVVAGVTGRTPRVRLRVGRELWPYTVLKPFIPSRTVDRLLSGRFDLGALTR